MTSKIKVDNINKVSDDSNIINKCGTTVTVGAASDGVRTGADNLQAADGGNLISQSGTTITLGASGDTITLACGASQSGFGRSGSVNWCTTAKTSPFTAANGIGYFVNTAGGAVTVTLPASPSAGDIVAINDYGSTFGTHNVTLGNNSSKINGQAQNAFLDTSGQSVELVYVDATKGWKTVADSDDDVTGSSLIAACGGNTTITCGDFKTHIFTADGPFTVTSGGGPLGTAEYFVIAGGGSGGTAGYGGAGGGAGGFRLGSPTVGGPSPLNGTSITMSPGSFPIQVGAGGTMLPSPDPAPNQGGSGTPSIFSTVTSAGGGGGGGDQTPASPPFAAGLDGGSGGGSGRTGAAVGSGNVPTVSPPQGNPGGQGDGGPTRSGGGGGGAGAAGGAGTEGPPGVAGPGGAGSFLQPGFVGPTAPSYGTPGPSPERYFAGGGGGSNERPGTAGSGGAGGGGAGYQNASGPGTAGTANTGGGGGGSGSPYAGASGGSGIVMIRYKFQ